MEDSTGTTDRSFARKDDADTSARAGQDQADLQQSFIQIVYASSLMPRTNPLLSQQALKNTVGGEKSNFTVILLGKLTDG